MSTANRTLNPLVSFLYRISGGRVPSHMEKAPIMLLTTTGFKTGKQRTNPVLYLLDAENLVTAASAGGADKNPSWFVNLKHNREALVTIRREKLRVRAREASPEERSRLWPLLTGVFHGYENYSKKTKRLIPVVIFEPIQDDRAAERIQLPRVRLSTPALPSPRFFVNCNSHFWESSTPLK